MKNKLILIFITLLDLNVSSQTNCNDLHYNNDSVVVLDNKPYSGYCDNFNKKGKIFTKSYFGNGLLDSIVYFDNNGIVEAIEPYRSDMKNGTFKSYYKTGTLQQSISFKNDKYFGFWREYYKNGKIKYEAEYIENNDLKDDSYYKWTKKGTKYLYKNKSLDIDKKVGKLEINFGVGRTKRVKVKNAT